MSMFTNEVRPLFSLELLKPLDTTIPDQMAQMLIGVYIVNSRAISTGQALITASNLQGIEKTDAERQLDLCARHNLYTVGEQLDGRSVTCIAVDGPVDPIKDRGMSSAPEVTGIPDMRHLYTMCVLAPSRQTGTLRLFKNPPPHPYAKETEWWDIEMVGPDFEPLVDIQINKQPRLQRVLGRLSRWGD